MNERIRIRKPLNKNEYSIPKHSSRSNVGVDFSHYLHPLFKFFLLCSTNPNKCVDKAISPRTRNVSPSTHCHIENKPEKLFQKQKEREDGKAQMERYFILLSIFMHHISAQTLLQPPRPLNTKHTFSAPFSPLRHRKPPCGWRTWIFHLVLPTTETEASILGSSSRQNTFFEWDEDQKRTEVMAFEEDFIRSPNIYSSSWDTYSE